MGIGVGLGLCLAFQRLDWIPTQITWEPFALAFGFSTLVGLVFGIQPARQAASLNPEECLR